jgi:hypothetical protein
MNEREELPPIVDRDPKELISRQTKREMTPNKVKKLRKKISKNGFDRNQPIEVIDVNGKLIIDALNGFSQTQKELIASCSKKYLSRSRLIDSLLPRKPTRRFFSSSSRDSLRYSSSSRSSGLFLLKIPKSVLINTLQETWEFQKHGSGILFKGNESGKVIDAHREIIDHSEAFDSWRLSQYFESLEYS